MAQKKILIIENDLVLASVYARHLEKEGFLVELIDSPLEGLAKIFSGVPDLILLDVVSSPIAGLSVLKILTNDSISKNIPVVAMDNPASDKNLIEAKRLGAKGTLIKYKTSSGKLLEAVKMLLED